MALLFRDTTTSPAERHTVGTQFVVTGFKPVSFKLKAFGAVLEIKKKQTDLLYAHHEFWMDSENIII